MARYSENLGSVFNTNIRALRIDYGYMPPRVVYHQLRIEADRGISKHHPLSEVPRVAATLNKCTKLKSVTIRIDCSMQWSWNRTGQYPPPNDQYKSYKAFVDRQFTALVEDLRKMRGLQNVELCHGHYYRTAVYQYAYNRMDMLRYLESIEEQVKSEATKPREQTTA